MRARTIREGSVGLLILLGIGLFGGLVLWLRGFNPTNRPYRLIAIFEDSMGTQLGTPVMYRGVPVGRVLSIVPRSNSVELELEITQQDLRMPSKVMVETVESGLIGEMFIEITPLVELSAIAADLSPSSQDCDSSVILCDGDRLEGKVGPSYEALLRSAGEVADLLADPELIKQLKEVLQTASSTTKQAGTLATEATALARTARGEIEPLADSANAAVQSASSAAQQVESAAAQFSLTATDINGLIGENRGMLVDTLGNLQATSVQLRGAADALGPTLESGELVGNLETLVTNASAASADLQTITSSLNTPANLVLLQQTLESARDALASAQKVMADIDEITGDPAVRNQLRELINGLGDLVSSTRSLEQHSEVARALTPISPGSAEMSKSAPDFASNVVAPDFAPNFAPNFESSRTAREAPVLVFDGERYILRPSDQLAPRANQPPVRGAEGSSKRLLESLRTR